MWNEARSSYRSPDKTKQQPQPSSTGCPFTPYRHERPSHRQSSRQCPLHFSECTHICLSCRKSICLRCAFTYCQNHVIRCQSQAIIELREQLSRLQLVPSISEIKLKLQQSRERQEYLEKKALKLIKGIESSFDYIADILVKKKLQIIQYYDAEFQKYLEDHRMYDAELKERIRWISEYTEPEEIDKLVTIEQIESLSSQIRKAVQEDSKTEKKLTRVVMGKDKIKVEKMWSEEHLEKVLYEIEHIVFRMDAGGGKVEKRKKRVTTENTNDHQNNTVGFVKSSSNSRLPSGRKHISPFN